MTKPDTPRPRFGPWALLICLLGAVAVLPLLCADSPCTHDGTAHYFRVVAMRHALRRGILFTRYLPDLAFGYGYPFFNYRASLPYYLILVLHLTGLGLPMAQNLAYALCILGSGLATYLLARDLFGTEAGVVAAVAYAYAPYQFLNALLRGNIPESIALLLMPLILWAFYRLALTGRRRWLLASVGSLTLLYLTHNISSLLFTPLLAAFLFVLWLVHRREGHWLAVGGAFVLALCLSSFFWGPAVLERDYVQLHMSYTTRNNDYHFNFIPLTKILSPPAPVDTSLMNPPMRLHLGLAQAILAGMGLVAGFVHWRDRERRALLVLFALAAVVMVWMSTRASLLLWEYVPLLRFVQFPWRLIGRAELPVALLAGALASVIAQRVSGLAFRISRLEVRASQILPPVLIGVLILAAFPYTYPPLGYCPEASHPTINDLHAYEYRTKRAGLAASGSFFPVWVQQRPEESLLQEQYAAGESVTRFDEAVLPEGAEVVRANYGPNRAQLIVESSQAFRARYLSFYFPGWRVWIDGERVEITPSDPQGLITFEVPAGRHAVHVRFGETRLRLAADAISALALLALVLLTILGPRSDVSTSSENLKSETRSLKPVGLLLTAALLLAFKLAVVDQMKTLFRHSRLRDDGTLPGVAHPLSRSYADGLTLIGYEQRTGEMPADDMLRVDLYWTVRQQPSRRYQTVIHLVGAEGFRWSQRDSFRPTSYHDAPSTSVWNPDRYALDGHEIEPLAGTPPGTYDIVLTVFDRETLAPLSVLNEQGQPAAPELTLGQVTLTSPRRSIKLEDLDVRKRLDASLGPLTLLGANVDRDEAAPGDPVFITTFWRAEEHPTRPLTLQLELLAADGSLAADYEFPPTASWHATSAWQPGDVWRGQHLLHLPAALDSATYTWRFSILHSPFSILHSPFSILHPSSLSVAAPDRTFRPPSSMDLAIDTQLDDVATLVGANLKPKSLNLKPGTSLTTTLVWRTEAENDVSYRVFLHLIGPGSALLAQADAVPGEWTRPTTGWLPGEYITDVHTLAIPDDAPAGDSALLVGLYTPDGGRLMTPDGADAIPIATVTIGTP